MMDIQFEMEDLDLLVPSIIAVFTLLKTPSTSKNTPTVNFRDGYRKALSTDHP